jgi:GNAT superfamily N-acetyltransferase
MLEEHIPGAVALQRACFPAPFPEELLWNSRHLAKHLSLFPEGQFVALDDDRVVASASATRISEENWQAHSSWEETVGGPFLESFDETGSTLYGLDISVHPVFRGKGLGRMLYQERFKLVKYLDLTRYGTACRLPDYRTYESNHQGVTVDEYAEHVVQGSAKDRTLSPLLRYGLTFLGVIHKYMEDWESDDAAALLEWRS